jgi:hypothetical protein
MVEDKLAHWPIACADVQDDNRRVVWEREEVAHQLEALGSGSVLSLLPSDPLINVCL